MKRILAMLCATMLCVCCLALAACGGSGSSSAASSGSASGSASASAAVDYTGDWKFAGMQMNLGTGEVTMIGDLDALAQMTGNTSTSMTFGLSLKADGTGAFVSGDSTYPVTWTESASGITIKDASDASGSAASASASAASDSASASASSADGFGGMGDTLELGYSDGVLAMSIEQNGQAATVFFSKDGKLPGASEIVAENAKPITNEADLIGDWKFSGMNLLGLSIYGDAETLNSLSGSSGTDMSISFQAGGKGTMSGSEFTYTVGADGAAMDSNGTKIPLKSLDGSLMIDMSEQIGMPMIMVFSK